MSKGRDLFGAPFSSTAPWNDFGLSSSKQSDWDKEQFGQSPPFSSTAPWNDFGLSSGKQSDWDKQQFGQRSELKEKEEELRSFKDRVAKELSVSMKKGDTECMNSPVSKTRLKEMYDHLRLVEWPKMKAHIKSKERNPKFAKALIQDMFEAAREKMEKKKKQIEKVFELKNNIKGPLPEKAAEFAQFTTEKLQMCLFHNKQKVKMQTPFPEYEGENPQDMMVILRQLASECYWLSCLMALNDPPFQPDWDGDTPTMDKWDIFPRDIKFLQEVKSEPVSQQ